MESWNEIINIALVGTDKRVLKKENLGADIADYFDLIAQTETREEVFLRAAALLYNYRQCGFLPLSKETFTISKADTEDKEYVSPVAHQILQDIFDTGSISLFEFWLQHCFSANKIVQPDAVAALLDAGTKNKQLQSLIHKCCGKRGEWLMQFNDAWKYPFTSDEDELWQTGTSEQRKKILAQIRKNEPEKGRELLQQVWPQENAASKSELIQQLAINAGEDDLPWLEELMNEKSIKVKDEVLKILKSIPSSFIVQKYWRILRMSVSKQQSKSLLGIGKKETLAIKLTQVDDEIFKTGIQQVASEKNANDESFILYQLIGAVPPDLWEEHLEMDRKTIIETLLKDQQFASLVGAFGLAASRFNNHDWLRTVITLHKNSLHIDAFKLLLQKEAELYALQFLSSDEGASSVLHVISFFSEEWGMEFSKAVFKFTAKNPYKYNKAFYDQIVHLLPVSLVGELEKFTPKEEHLAAVWVNLTGHIMKLLAIKLQTLKAFNE